MNGLQTCFIFIADLELHSFIAPEVDALSDIIGEKTVYAVNATVLALIRSNVTRPLPRYMLVLHIAALCIGRSHRVRRPNCRSFPHASIVVVTIGRDSGGRVHVLLTPVVVDYMLLSAPFVIHSSCRFIRCPMYRSIYTYCSGYEKSVCKRLCRSATVSGGRWPRLQRPL